MINKIKMKKTYQSNNKLLNAKKVIYKCLKPITVLVFALTLLNETLVAGFNCLPEGTVVSEKTLVTDLNLSPSFKNSQENLVFGDGGKKQDLENLSKRDTQNRSRSWSKWSVPNGHGAVKRKFKCRRR